MRQSGPHDRLAGRTSVRRTLLLSFLCLGASLGFAVAQTPAGNKAGNLTFNLVFEDVEDVSGVGFDDPTLGATRRNTAAAVFDYLNRVLNETTSATLDITFLASGVSGSGTPITHSTFVVASPNRYTGGDLYDHILSGVDPAVTNDLEITIDFGFPWNSSLGLPAAGQIDLASAILRVAGGALGMQTLTDSGGFSRISATNPGVFSVWDRLLETGTGTDLWDNDPANPEYLPSDEGSRLASQDVIFTGTNARLAFGGNPPVYAPPSFDDPTSVAFFDTSVAGAVMTPFLFAGEVRRAFAPFEIGVLQDIGYSKAAAASGIGGGHGIETALAPAYDDSAAVGVLPPTAGTIGIISLQNLSTSPLDALVSYFDPGGNGLTGGSNAFTLSPEGAVGFRPALDDPALEGTAGGAVPDQSSGTGGSAEFSFIGEPGQLGGTLFEVTNGLDSFADEIPTDVGDTLVVPYYNDSAPGDGTFPPTSGTVTLVSLYNGSDSEIGINVVYTTLDGQV